MHKAESTASEAESGSSHRSSYRGRAFIAFAIILLLTAAGARLARTEKPAPRGLEVPDATQRAEALSSVRGLPGRAARTYTPGRNFEPITAL